MTAEVTSPDPMTMSDHARLVEYRLLRRRLKKQKKLWNGKVSEANTALEHLQDAATPDTDAECRVRLEQMKRQSDVVDQMKADRKSTIDVIERAMDEILWARPAKAEQLVLGATKMPITKETALELRAALNDAAADDAEAASKGETPDYPPEKPGDMDDLRARLDALLAEAGLDAVTFAPEIPAEQADPDAEVVETEKPANTSKGRSSKGRGNLSAVT